MLFLRQNPLFSDNPLYSEFLRDKLACFPRFCIFMLQKQRNKHEKLARIGLLIVFF